MIAAAVETGFRDGMTFAEYQRAEALSASGVVDLLDCPAVYRYYRDCPEARKDTEASEFGTAVHVYTLEGEAAFLARYMVLAPGFSKSKTKADAENVAAVLAHEAAGGKTIKQDAYDQVRRVHDAIRACPDAARILLAAEATERAAFFDADDVRCKARFDVDATESIDMIADLKVCADPNPDRWGHDRYGLARAIQAEFYASGYHLAGGDAVPAFAWIVAPSEPPYTGRVWVGAPSDRYTAVARRKIDRALAIYRRCMKFNEWPGYGAQVREIEPPAWMEESA